MVRLSGHRLSDAVCHFSRNHVPTKSLAHLIQRHILIHQPLVKGGVANLSTQRSDISVASSSLSAMVRPVAAACCSISTCSTIRSRNPCTSLCQGLLTFGNLAPAQQPPSMSRSVPPAAHRSSRAIGCPFTSAAKGIGVAVAGDGTAVAGPAVTFAGCEVAVCPISTVCLPRRATCCYQDQETKQTHLRVAHAFLPNRCLITDHYSLWPS